MELVAICEHNAIDIIWQSHLKIGENVILQNTFFLKKLFFPNTLVGSGHPLKGDTWVLITYSDWGFNVDSKNHLILCNNFLKVVKNYVQSEWKSDHFLAYLYPE